MQFARFTQYLIPFLLIPGISTAQFCENRYESGQRILESAYSKYGTLYSGGAHFGGLNNIGGTMDVFRAIRGLPHLDFANRTDSNRLTFIEDTRGNGGFGLIPNEELIINTESHLEALTTTDQYWLGVEIAGILLDLATPTGPYPGWWLDEGSAVLSDLERDLTQFSKDDRYNWLMMTQAASYAPWAFNWSAVEHSYDPDQIGDQQAYARLAERAAQKFTETDDPVWAVASASLTPQSGYNAQLSFNITDWHTDQTTRVMDCTATRSEYVAWAIVTYELMRIQRPLNLSPNLHALPPTLRDSIARNRLIAAVLEGSWQWPDDKTTAQVLDLSDDPNFGTWYRAWLSFQAGTVEDFIKVHKDHDLGPTAFRIANLFSVKDITRIARARQDNEQDYRQFLTAAFFRNFALERDVAAMALLPEITALWPAMQHYIYTVEKSDVSDAVKLARIATAFDQTPGVQIPNTAILPTAQHLERSYHADAAVANWAWGGRSFDLGREFRQASSLQADFETWAFHPIRDERILRPGYLHGALHRSYQRNLPLRASGLEQFPKLLNETTQYWQSGYKVSDMIAWDELAQLGSETGLANRIATVLIANAKHETRNWIWTRLADQDKLAREMQHIIHMARQMHSGRMSVVRSGHDHFRPVGWRAFDILKQRLPNTEIAKQTRYWYICRDRCEAP